jgi:hypothetical protein
LKILYLLPEARGYPHCAKSVLFGAAALDGELDA